ncbi:MAG: hypothetical protein H6737_14445 [Alphaproteobacteria bacterium]|nr:hypothetical protein [Alphaproteobacteria bacterium]
MPPIENLIAIVCMLSVFAFVFSGTIFGLFAARWGRKEVAVVRSSERTDILDERKQYKHRLVLELKGADGAPYEVTVVQTLPWVRAMPPSPGSRVQVKVLGRGRGVFVLGPAMNERFEKALADEGITPP